MEGASQAWDARPSSAPLVRLSNRPGAGLFETEPLPAARPDRYACLPPVLGSTALVITTPEWAFQVTGFDRQAVLDAFFQDPDLGKMDELEDKVERLQRIMTARRELVELHKVIATIRGKRSVGGQSKEQVVIPLRKAATEQSKLHTDIQLLKMGVSWEVIDKPPERISDSEVQAAILKDIHHHAAPGIVGLAAAAADLQDDPHDDDPDGDGEDEDEDADEDEEGVENPGSPPPPSAPSPAETPVRPSSHAASGSTMASAGCFNSKRPRRKNYTVPCTQAEMMEVMRKQLLTFAGAGRHWQESYRDWPTMTIPAPIKRKGVPYETHQHAAMDRHYVDAWMFFRKLLHTRLLFSYFSVFSSHHHLVSLVSQLVGTCARAAGVPTAASSSGASPSSCMA